MAVINGLSQSIEPSDLFCHGCPVAKQFIPIKREVQFNYEKVSYGINLYCALRKETAKLNCKKASLVR